VVGVGVFGRNHARVYKELELQGEPVRLLGVVDPDLNRADAVAREFGCKAFGSVLQMLTTHSELQAASVASPTVHHLSVARDLMKAGVDVLIEKPLAATLDEADELVALAGKHKRIAQVGHLERFNPAVRATIPLITQPMFFEVHRLSVFTPRSLDVDVVLDLMIHDLDISGQRSAGRGIADLVRESGYRERSVRTGVGLHRQFHSQPGLDRTRTQAAILPTAAVCFARLRAAGSSGVHSRRG
jgi:predicted dehydrogenase